MSILNKKVTIIEVTINWLKMRWIKLKRSKSHIIQFKYDFNEDSELSAINIRKSFAETPLGLKDIDQPFLYSTGRIVTRKKRKNMMDLLKCIPPIKHDYYKNIRTNRHNRTSNTTDQEDIIDITDESI